MREVLIEELYKEVHGPRGGLEEVLKATENPLKEYVTGVIIPRLCPSQQRDPESESGLTLGGSSAADNASDELQASPMADVDPQTRPKSFGISFVTSEKHPTLKICVTWARYSKRSINGETAWKRTPYYAIDTVFIDDDKPPGRILSGSSGSQSNSKVKSDSDLKLYVRRIQKAEDQFAFLVSVVNDTPIDPERCYPPGLTQASIFQPSIRILIKNGRAKLGSKTVDAGSAEPLEFLYRDRVVRARGHMCSAMWKEVDFVNYVDQSVWWPEGDYFNDCSEFKEPDFRSEFVPLFQTAAPDFSWNTSKSGRQPELSAAALSELWDPEQIDASLKPLTEAYEQWVETNESYLGDLAGNEKEISSRITACQREVLDRTVSGVDLLKKNEDARIAFCFANKVMDLQHSWKRSDSDEALKWRPFQLAFFLLCIESICIKSSKYREHTDLLWIPTGGGKTEAYLAIMAFTMAFRRRESRLRYMSGAGTSVITRYTLRLLTIQQFRRTVSMVAAAEYLRVLKCGEKRGWRPAGYSADADWIYGTERFSVGLWVGQDVTPNHLRAPGQAIDALLNPGGSSEPAQVTRCPACKAWLSVPRSGLPAGTNELYLVVRSEDDLEKALESQYPTIISRHQILKDLKPSRHNLPEGYVNLTLSLDSEAEMKEQDIDDMVQDLGGCLKFHPASFRASRPGYFGYASELRRGKDNPADFEIYCPNPDCALNNGVSYIEGVPTNTEGHDSNQLQVGLVEKGAPLPFLSGKRIPIPSYTVDEQIYCKCPTVVVCTADKIARLAFEPRAATIFGNVDCYNPYYGYHRSGLLPRDFTSKAMRMSKEIGPLLPPDLIIQDELHLIEGPLGSMYGLYEAVVSALIRSSATRLKQNTVPKYIASTATIRNADVQVRNLFARHLSQFPAYGLHADDNFFVRIREQSERWDEQIPGQAYLGVCAPGTGVQTVLTRLWARFLKARTDCKDDPYARYFWTVVGYFNAIRELGGARALYREDVLERLGQIGGEANLDPSKVFDLSSLTDSTNVPQILSELEACEWKPAEMHPDAVFTTSMFGTGVDIPHLSSMIVNGQPKTTSQYIQATGRVGRKHGGLVVTFYRAGRARDLNHYEMFAAYHSRMYLEVEPSSVSPFSDGVLARALGPALVAFLRNKSDPSVAWYKTDGSVILEGLSSRDIAEFKESLSDRLVFVEDGSKVRADKFVDELQNKEDRWNNVARSVGDGNLAFVEYPMKKIKRHVVLGDPAHELAETLCVVFRNAPESLREVEETTAFEV